MWGRRNKPNLVDTAGMAMLCELLEVGVDSEKGVALLKAAYRGALISKAVKKLAISHGVRLDGARRHVVPPPGSGEWAVVEDFYECPAERRCARRGLKSAGIPPPRCAVAGRPMRQEELP